MSQANATQSPQAALRSRALKIVLFGRPDAGKTSLLGALAQAAQTQESVLGGTVTGASDLDEVRRQVYEGRPPRTANDLVAYPMVFRPDPAAPTINGRGPLDLVLFDCDGRGASEFFAERATPLTDQKGALASALRDADALLLTVDASATPEVHKRDFSQFINFLNMFQASRSGLNEVNGLPVYIVLTKCDLLASAGDSPSAWMDRVEERKNHVAHFFREQLEQEGTEQAQPFGGIDLHVWATAVHRPAFANAPARPQEPYQVAELFRQTIGAAVDYQQLEQKAQHRLTVTIAAAVAVAALLFVLALIFWTTREQPAAVQLENKIKNFLGTYNKNSPDRFRNAAEAIPRLEKFKDDPAFAIIAPDLRNWVNHELAEVRAYRKFDEELKKETIDPAIISSDDKLKEQKSKLELLTPPKDYAADWQDTPAVQLRAQRLEDIKAISLTLQDVKAKLDQVLVLAKDLKKDIDEYEKLSASQKLEAAKDILKRQETLRELAAELPVRKKATKDYFTIKGSDHVTWATIFRFPEIERRYSDWEALEPKALKSII